MTKLEMNFAGLTNTNKYTYVEQSQVQCKQTLKGVEDVTSDNTIITSAPNVEIILKSLLTVIIKECLFTRFTKLQFHICIWVTGRPWTRT